MPKISRRTENLGTENAFVVLAEVNEARPQGKDLISFCIGQPDFHTPANIQDAAVRAVREGKHGYTPSAGIAELREAAARYMGEMRDLAIRPEDVVIGGGAKPFIAYTILSTTDYGVGDEVIYPNPGFPIYESQIVANGAVPVPLHLREARNFAFDPAELESKLTQEDQAPHPQLAPEPDRRHPGQEGSRGDRRDPEPPSGRLDLRGRDLLAAVLRGRVLLDRVAPGHVRAHHHLGRRFQDLGDDRLADRLRLEPGARAAVRALGHQHRLVRLAHQPVGRGRGGQRARRTTPQKMRDSFLARRDLIVGLLNKVPGVFCKTPAAPSTPGPT